MQVKTTVTTTTMTILTTRTIIRWIMSIKVKFKEVKKWTKIIQFNRN